VCPNCKVELVSANARPIFINSDAGVTWNGIVYECPQCRSALSVAIDPLQIKREIVQEIASATRRDK
jgi:hypothetical protein